MAGFDADWLAARRPFDDAALDRAATDAIRSWAEALPVDRGVRVVDLGSGTGVALRRAAHWLRDREISAVAVDSDSELLVQAPTAWLRDGADAISEPGGNPPPDPVHPYVAHFKTRNVMVSPRVGDVLDLIRDTGDFSEGEVDLVLGHAVADLLPLDRLARRLAALLRPGGLAHLALTYDGKTSFTPTDESGHESRVIAAYHRHMDRRRAEDPAHGGSTAGRRLPGELVRAGLQVVSVARSPWDVRPGGTPGSAAVLDRMLRFVVDSVTELGDPPAAVVARWEVGRRVQLRAAELGLRVEHRDVLARRAHW